jgi:hypothetical protein
MHASVHIATAQPGKLDEAIKIVRDSILPAAKKQKGFKGQFFLTDYNTGKGIGIDLWNTEADMAAAEASANYLEQLAKLRPIVAGPGTMEHYEVSVRA